MGLCCSCHSTSVAKSMLILPDGSLQEFSYAVKVSDALHKNPDTFICNSDDMEFDDIVSAIKDDDELQPGQLYFALPLKRLKYPLQPEEMAALAVKAAAALAKGGCRRRRQKNIRFTFSGEKGRARSSSKVADAETLGLSYRSYGGGGGKGQNFKAMLSAIPE
ncbi:unnamed protein product [Lactuca saligna]|uniref:Uncharacterized protein n=1 Tax=Lactuca saligna TaxID=75948 RepID=A0AA35YMM2_LACSI|nr:unnamed protein product [Lactuca saligna]